MLRSPVTRLVAAATLFTGLAYGPAASAQDDLQRYSEQLDQAGADFENMDADDTAYVQIMDDACPRVYENLSEDEKRECLAKIRGNTADIAIHFREVTNDASLLLEHAPWLGYARVAAHKECGAALDDYLPMLKGEEPLTDRNVVRFTAGIGACLQQMMIGMDTEADLSIKVSQLGTIHIEAKCMNGYAAGSKEVSDWCTTGKENRAEILKLARKGRSDLTAQLR